MNNIKLKIINPDCGLTEEDWHNREAYLKKATAPTTELSMVSPQNNTIYVDSGLEEALAAPEIIRLGKLAFQDGYDGIGLYCFSDPALEALRELLPIPVVGAGQASFSLASLLGNRFSVLVTSETRVPQKKAAFRAMGITNEQLASVRGVDCSAKDTKQLFERLAAVGASCVKEDRAEVIVLGCLVYNYYAEELTKLLNVPVINPGFTLVNTLEMIVQQQLAHSKITYPTPKNKKRIWDSGEI